MVSGKAAIYDKIAEGLLMAIFFGSNTAVALPGNFWRLAFGKTLSGFRVAAAANKQGKTKQASGKDPTSREPHGGTSFL